MSAPTLRPPILAANWKMHHGPSQARAFVASFLARYSPRSDRTIILCPSALALSATRDALGDRTDILLGVQNIHEAEKGAFTGESSAAMALDAGATVALVGHSERRHIFGESDSDAARKCAAALRAGLVPMLCIGETIEEREADRTERVVMRQLDAVLEILSPDERARLLIAYEPVWAIGTGRTATPADASVVQQSLHRRLAEAVSAGSQPIPVLYGGSVNAGNASALLAAPGVDGLLVGGASLDPESWTAIATAAASGS